MDTDKHGWGKFCPQISQIDADYFEEFYLRKSA
jgi:hypothetical protein